MTSGQQPDKSHSTGRIPLALNIAVFWRADSIADEFSAQGRAFDARGGDQAVEINVNDVCGGQ
jgi:hypothetical protein